MTAIAGANIRLGGDESGLISSLANARRQVSLFTREVNGNVVQAFRAADAQQRILRGGLTRLGDEITGIGKRMALVGTLPTLFAAGKAYKDFADVQRLEKGLALYGSTLEDIRRLAKEPNIGVFDGAKSLVGLRAAKIEAGLAERAVKSFANAIAAAGGNQADLEPALLNLKQFKATKNINQVDLRQLANRIPQSSDAILKAFGTLDTEKLNKIGIDKFISGFITELEKIPKVAGGAGVAMEQVADSATFFSATIGESIEKAFDVSSKISAIGAFLDDLATNFKSLNPEAQKAILWIGGMAVVIPPLVIAVGGLIKLIPLIATGFGAISWPVVAILATGAAVAGLIALMPLLTSNTAEYNKQQALVADFAPKLNPLIEQYEALKQKATLTSSEQSKLKDITKQIADLVPTAVTGWDKYGTAIDINTGKVKVYTEEQKKLLVAMQATRREQLIAENLKLSIRGNELQNSLNSGQTKTRVNLGMGVYQDQNHTLNQQDIVKSGSELANLRQQEAKNRKELLSLGGQDIYVKEVEKLKEMQAERAKVSKEYKESLRSDNVKLTETLGERARTLDKDIAKQKGKVDPMVGMWNKAKEEARVAAGIKIVPEKGIKELEKAVKDTTKVYKEMSAAEREIAAIDLSMKYQKDKDALKAKVKEYKEMFGVVAALDLKLQTPIGSKLGGTVSDGSNLAKARASQLADRKLGEDMRANQAALNNNSAVGDSRKSAARDLKSILGDSAALKDLEKYFETLPVKVGESASAYQQRISEFVDATASLNAGLSGALKEAAAGAAEGFGEMLGNLVSGVGGVESFAKNVMGRIGALLKSLGKSLIGFGTAGIALKVFAKNPYLALAAGVALVALGQVATNSVKDKTSQATTKFAKGGMAFREMPAIVGDNPNARFDPEIIAPYSKIHESIKKSIGESGGNGGGVFIPELKIRGEDMFIAFNRASQRNKALGRA